MFIRWFNLKVVSVLITGKEEEEEEEEDEEEEEYEEEYEEEEVEA